MPKQPIKYCIFFFSEKGEVKKKSVEGGGGHLKISRSNEGGGSSQNLGMPH